MSCPANQISQPNRAIHIELLKKIERRINSSTDQEQKQRLEGLKVIVTEIVSEIEKETSNDEKNSYQHLTNDELSDLKNLNIYLQKIKSFENHENLLKILNQDKIFALEKLASILKIKNFTKKSYGNGILNGLTDPDSFFAFAHLDKILRAFAVIPKGILCEEYFIKTINGITFKAWHSVFSLEDLASLFNMSAPILTKVRKKFPEYNKDPDSKKKLPDNQPSANNQALTTKATDIILPQTLPNNLDPLPQMKKRETKRSDRKRNNFYDLPPKNLFLTQKKLNPEQPNNSPAIERLDEIESHIISSPDSEQKLLERFNVIVSEINKEDSNNSKNTHKKLNDDDFSDLKNLSIYLQKIDSFKNHEKLLQSYSLKELASFLKIKTFTNISYCYRILSSLIDPASFSAFSDLIKVFNKLVKQLPYSKCQKNIKEKIDGETFRIWNSVFSIEELALLFNKNKSTFYNLRNNEPKYNRKNSDSIINSLVISSSDSEQKKLIEGLKAIVSNIVREASSKPKKTHADLTDNDFSGLKNLNIYLQKIENFENHANLLKILPLKKLAKVLKIKNFNMSSYSYKILSSLIDPNRFSAFSHLDKILRAFSKIPSDRPYEAYFVESIDGETFKTWNHALSAMKLAPLFNIDTDTLCFFINNNPNYNKDHSVPIKELPNSPLSSLEEIENLIISRSDPEQIRFLELLKVIIYKIDTQDSSNSENTYKYLNNNDFSDLKNLSLYLQTIESFENHQNLREILSLEELASFLKIKDFTKSSYSYEILSSLIDSASFSSFAHLDKILKEFPNRRHNIIFQEYIQKKINSETFKTWNRTFSARKLAPLFDIGKDTLCDFINNKSRYVKDYSAQINDLPDNQINPNQEISSHQAPSINPSNVISTELLQYYDLEQMNKWLDNISNPVLSPDSFSPMADNHFNPLTSVTPPSNLKDETLPLNLSSGLDFDMHERDSFFSNRKTNGSFLTTAVSKKVFGDPDSADESLNGKRTCIQVDGLHKEMEELDEVQEFLNRKYP